MSDDKKQANMRGIKDILMSYGLAILIISIIGIILWSLGIFSPQSASAQKIETQNKCIEWGGLVYGQHVDRCRTAEGRIDLIAGRLICGGGGKLIYEVNCSAWVQAKVLEGACETGCTVPSTP